MNVKKVETLAYAGNWRCKLLDAFFVVLQVCRPASCSKAAFSGTRKVQGCPLDRRYMSPARLSACTSGRIDLS